MNGRYPRDDRDSYSRGRYSGDSRDSRDRGYDSRDYDDRRDRRRGKGGTYAGKRPPSGFDDDRRGRFARTGDFARDRDYGSEGSFERDRYDAPRSRSRRGTAGARDRRRPGTSHSRADEAQAAAELAERGRPKREGGKKTNQFREACQLLQLLGAPLTLKRLSAAVQAQGRYDGGRSVQDACELFSRRLRPPGGRGQRRLESSELMGLQRRQLLGDKGPIAKSTADFADRGGRGNSIDIEAWLERLLLETTKHSLMQRMFIQMKKRMGAFRLASVRELIKFYKVEVTDSGRVRGAEFLKILGRIGVIRNHVADDIQYVLDEYQHIDQAEYEAQQKK